VANGEIRNPAIKAPIYSPQVSESETQAPTEPPTSIAISSKMNARVAVRNTAQKWPRTSWLLRFKADTGPSRSVLITDVNSD
jgi:hypothetical protein